MKTILIALAILVAFFTARARAFASTLEIIPEVYYVMDINDRGDLVGQYSAEGSAHGYLLRQGTLSTIAPPGSVVTEANGINNRGDIVGHFRDPNHSAGMRGFILSQGTYTVLDFASDIEVWSVNNVGDTVGDYIDEKGRHGFLLSGDIVTTIDYPGSGFTEAVGINDRGDVVGNCGFGGFLLRNGVFTLINPPDSVWTRIDGVNNLGEIVGKYYTASPPTVETAPAFVYSRGTFLRIDTLPGATYTEIWGINNRGELTGNYGGDYPGGSCGFVLRP